MAEQITVWSKSDTCQPCRLTKKKLLDAGVAFTERSLEDASAEQLAAFREAGFMTAPVVLTERHGSWSGFNPARIKSLIAATSSNAADPAAPPIHGQPPAPRTHM